MLQNQFDEPCPPGRLDIPVMEPSSWDVRMTPERILQPVLPFDRAHD